MAATNEVATRERPCPVCGAFSGTRRLSIFWPELIEQWNLSPEEAERLEARDALECRICRANLRSMTMALALRRAYNFRLPLFLLPLRHPLLRVLEINSPGKLRRYLRGFIRNTYADYPEVRIEELPYPSERFDLVLHADTLEHVEDPIPGLRECNRVLRTSGYLCYTIPIVTGRATRSREGLPPSFHGSSATREYLVHTEYGDDFWQQPFEAGFSEVRLVSVRYPSSFAILCRK